MDRFKMSPALWKWSGLVSAITTVCVLVAAGVLSQMASDDGANVLISVVLGLAIGGLARAGVKRGWSMGITRHSAASIWSRSLRLGVAWRALCLFFAGKLLINVFDQAAWSDASETVLMLVALLLITEVALLVGLRYGWTASRRSEVNAETGGA